MLLHPGITLTRLENSQFMLFNTMDQSYYRLGEDEGKFLLSYDPQCGEEIELGWDAQTSAEAEKIFAEMNVLYDETNPVPKQKLKNKWNIIQIKIAEISIDQFLDRISGIIRALTSRKCIRILTCIVLLALALALSDFENLAGKTASLVAGLLTLDTLRFEQIAPSSIIVTYLILIVSVFVHETAHIFMCKRVCGKVGKVGFMLYFMQPALYSDLTYLYTLKNKKEKLKVLFAGIFIQLVLSALCLIAYVIASKSIPNGIDFLLLFALLNLVIALYNLIPFIKLDGYWILSSLLDVQHLYNRSFALLLGKLRIGQKAAVAPPSRQEKSGVFLGYALAASVFFMLIWVYVLYSMYGTVEASLGDHGAWGFIGFMVGLLSVQLAGKLHSFKKKQAAQVSLNHI